MGTGDWIRYPGGEALLLSLFNSEVISLLVVSNATYSFLLQNVFFLFMWVLQKCRTCHATSHVPFLYVCLQVNAY